MPLAVLVLLQVLVGPWGQRGGVGVGGGGVGGVGVGGL